MIGNVITFNSIYTQISNAAEANNTNEVFYQVGRILFLLLEVQPLEFGTLADIKPHTTRALTLQDYLL